MINSIVRLVCKALKKPLPHKLWRYGDLPEWRFIARVLPRDVAVAIKDVVIRRVKSEYGVEFMIRGLCKADIDTLFDWKRIEEHLRVWKGIEYDFLSRHLELQEQYGDDYDLRRLPPSEQATLFPDEEASS